MYRQISKLDFFENEALNGKILFFLSKIFFLFLCMCVCVQPSIWLYYQLQSTLYIYITLEIHSIVQKLCR